MESLVKVGQKFNCYSNGEFLGVLEIVRVNEKSVWVRYVGRKTYREGRESFTRTINKTRMPIL